MAGTVEETSGGERVGRWPWLVMALMMVPAVWHVLDFPDETDPEFPLVVRPTFSRMPPPAYRLAEPGDTIDRVALYLAAGAVAMSACALLARRRSAGGVGLWPSALGLALAATWHAATPWPTFDGWHGLGWRAIADASAPTGLRLALVAAASGLTALVVVPIVAARMALAPLWRRGRSFGCLGLLGAALVLVGLRQVELPGVEPAGYWPRWAFALGLLAFDLALGRAMPAPPSAPGRWALRGAGAAAWAALVGGGLSLIWYHRPLERLRAVAPGKIYISAMPTYRGLQVAHARHHFKTIINLFPEHTRLRSPLLGDELRFAREHGIEYVGSPPGVVEADGFLDRTLALAQDPDAWPILVHCHGCMDRTPAWMGIYRFVVEGRPLDAILREIEQHRGYRPKASVTLLYNRVLPPRAPGRYLQDPTARLLRQCAAGTRDPYFDELQAEARRANPASMPSVTLGEEPIASRPRDDAID